ncbi:hypothetical protein PHIM7_180 [Sinorhizobium phage phiM7]|uniref:Uncharacterized protein n=3 Tax=Emdodecavirus TaxID=1980937 RepID=S5MD65_9CAUD|nr:hypothetical protein AB690_gp319 [Sinorhizobium phage phiM12]YP_009212431.1 hypothetical protein AVT40_gp342 [Sinorhizobium phage phiN3]YP_009601305.1 hypothetical protein FDH46_gp298 [Sinorhizobium phage phiM7]AKF13085.1 hypothetical protein PHIM19_180 [Sinorhizobium phage phiM19]AGR47884.1 hypothetical protein SmphiM12_252 [Sinorhizobium phage phiM12]AKF12725.1 hypothetical protein PHIM7_180 [Sinorhizobium phage phiM7]AKF13454.1 hypothetical protein PHIN3_191 [Sinorhizobium phage phiN3]
MAKKGGNKTAYTSKGIHSTAKASTLSAVRADRSLVDVALNVRAAYEAGRNPWVTIDNPNKQETAKKRIRIKANDLWGSPKERREYVMPGTGEAKKKKATNNA